MGIEIGPTSKVYDKWIRWGEDDGRRWLIQISGLKGLWFSLGVHIDLGSPEIDIHIGWWLISIGRCYPLSGWYHQHTFPDDEEALRPVVQVPPFEITLKDMSEEDRDELFRQMLNEADDGYPC